MKRVLAPSVWEKITVKRFYQQRTKYNKIKIKATLEEAIRPRGRVDLWVYPFFKFSRVVSLFRAIEILVSTEHSPFGYLEELGREYFVLRDFVQLNCN